METVSFLRAMSVVAGFAAASLAVPELVGAIRRVRAAWRADAITAAGTSAPAARLLRNGVPFGTDVARAASRLPGVHALLADMCWLAQSRGYETDEYRFGGIVVLAAAIAVPIGFAISSSIAFGLMFPACCVGGFALYARQKRERQLEDVRESVPDMLRTMSACFRSGYSLLQTFRHLAVEAKGPLRPLFQRAASDLETGRTASDALRCLREESTLREFAFLTAALEIQHQTGGSMQSIIDSACDSVEGELALRRSLRVQTAQARLSMRVVTLMPFVLMAVFSLVSPEFLAPFFSSGLGIALFCAAMGMQVTGVLVVRRMLNVKEG